jgi:dihydropteroate synthase
MNLHCAGKSLDLSRAVIMGVLNITPDSFSDGGQFIEPADACRQAESMLRSGAQIIDIGGESTRPGAQAVSVDEELMRVIPVISRLHREFDCIISVDTSKPEVMLEAVASGASLINDVCGLSSQASMEAAFKANVPVCIMHMQGDPRSMQADPSYDNVADEVRAFLMARASECMDRGISKSNIIIDPGFGFGKKVHHNVQSTELAL